MSNQLLEVEKERSGKAIQLLITVIYIVVPFALYVNVVTGLNIIFNHDVWHLRFFLAFMIFGIISYILVCIERNLVPILVNEPKKVSAKGLTVKTVKDTTILSSIMVFLTIVFIPLATADKNINFSFVTIVVSAGYTLFFYYVLKTPLSFIKDEIVVDIDTLA